MLKIEGLVTSIATDFNKLKSDAKKMAEAQKGDVIEIGDQSYVAKGSGPTRRFREIKDNNTQKAQ